MAPSGIPGDLPVALPSMGVLLGGLFNSPITRETTMVTTNEKLEIKDSSTPGDSSKGSKEDSSQGELLHSEALQGATGQNPCTENLEGLTEKVGTLSLQGHKKNWCGATERQARRAKHAQAPTGESASGQTLPPQSDQPHTQ
jgi:hypothetical protein